MRKHLYLIVENDHRPDRVGGVRIQKTRLTPSSKNEQTVHHMRNFETGEEWSYTAVSMGYVDFADEDEYEKKIGDAVNRKLSEIDEEHLIDAGLDPAEVFEEEGEDEEELVTDGGVDAADLTAFQQNILVILAEEPMYGLAIKRNLEAYYGTEVNHGRLYPNLDDLVEYGFVEKSELDKRTNQYELTEAGLQVVLGRFKWMVEKFVTDRGRATSVSKLVDEHTPTNAVATDGGEE